MSNKSNFAAVFFIFIMVAAGIAAAQTPAPFDAGVLNGRAKTLAKPVYPPDADKTKYVGEVRVRVIVDAHGNVTNAEAITGYGVLRPAAVAAARSSKFDPKVVQGKAVEMKGIVLFNFVAPTATSAADYPSNQSVESALNGLFKDKTDFFNLVQNFDELKKGKKLYDEGDYAGAVKIFTGLTDKSDVASDAYAQRARAFFAMKKMDEALADAKKSLNLEPKNLEALNVRGLVAQVREQYDAAIKDYTQAVSIEPKFIKAYFNRGNSYLGKKDLTAAAADFRKVREIDPNNQPAKQMLDKISAAATSSGHPDASPTTSTPGSDFDRIYGLSGDDAAVRKALATTPADNVFGKSLDGPAAQQRDAELRKKFVDLTVQFNALRKIYDQKWDTYSPIASKDSARFDRNIDPNYKKTAEDRSIRTSYCKALLELDPAITDLQKVAVNLREMDKNGEAAKAASADELGAMRDDLKKWDYQELHRPFSISVGDCRANPTDKEHTIDDIVKMANRENQQDLVKLMQKLGNFSGYLMATKKLAGVNFQTAAPSEICSSVLDLRKESDVIELDLTAFAKLYQYDTPPDFDDPAHPARFVTFEEPAITARAEKTLGLYNKLFLPNKELIKNTISKYGCK